LSISLLSAEQRQKVLKGVAFAKHGTLYDMTSMFSPFGLPEGITLLITDALSAPANFLLHRTLAAYMKDCRDVKCVVLSVSEDITRWKALAAKSVLGFSFPFRVHC
jgi:hypothetical protein